MAVIKHPSAATGGGDWADDLGTGAEIDGVASLKTQTSAPSASADYAKLAALEEGADANTVLLLHCDGSNLSQVVTDSSDSSHTVTCVDGGTAADCSLSTAQKKFGVSSLRIAAGQYITIPHSTDWDFGAGDFTFEMWMRFDAQVTSDVAFFGARRSTTEQGMYWYYDQSDAQRTYFRWRDTDDVRRDISFYGTYNLPAATWVHFAVCRRGTQIRPYVNGQWMQLGHASYETETQVGWQTLRDTTGPMYIGAIDNGGITSPSMYIDEIRISNVARYMNNFIPAEQAFPVTRLSHFDEAGTKRVLGS
jgi:hypothetical protein